MSSSTSCLWNTFISIDISSKMSRGYFRRSRKRRSTIVNIRYIRRQFNRLTSRHHYCGSKEICEKSSHLYVNIYPLQI